MNSKYAHLCKPNLVTEDYCELHGATRSAAYQHRLLCLNRDCENNCEEEREG